MALSSDLISQFAKITKDEDKKPSEATVNGTIVEYNGENYVQLDGSDLLTPISTTTDNKPGNRVTVLVKNHTATVSGNISSPSASSSDLKDTNTKIEEIGNQISAFEIVIADKVDTKEFNAEKARIEELRTDNVVIKKTLEANKASIDDLEADNVKINQTLEANQATIKELDTTKLDAEIANVTYATIKGLEATNLEVYNLKVTHGNFANLTTQNFTAIHATIKELDAEKISAKDIEGKYANIDFSNIGEAAIEKIFADSGLIKDLVVGDGTITGNLVGVTIKGDLIEGGTVVADKLVVKGKDGLYYKLNTDGVKTETEQTEYNSLNGSIITANSITATKISVDDLVAFDATIGGFNITENSLYSGVKSGVDNTTRGIYLDNEGQMAIGDASNFVKYYKDADGKYKLEISAASIKIGSSNTSVETIVKDAQEAVNKVNDLEERANSGEFAGEDATVLRIDSSRGTVFKNNAVSTVLSVVIYRGSKRITDITALKAEYGNSAYLEWQWQRMGESTFGTILSTDSRLSNGGFSFTLSPDDVDTKVVFMCQLITD